MVWQRQESAMVEEYQGGSGSLMDPDTEVGVCNL